MRLGDDFSDFTVDYSAASNAASNAASDAALGAPMTSTTSNAPTAAFQTPGIATSAADYSWLAPVATVAANVLAKSAGVPAASSPVSYGYNSAGQMVPVYSTPAPAGYAYNTSGQLVAQASLSGISSNMLLIGGGLLLLLLLK